MAEREATSWCPTWARASRTPPCRAGVWPSATTSSSTRRCAPWRPRRPRWRSPARMPGGSSSWAAAVGEVLPVGAVLVRIDTGAGRRRQSRRPMALCTRIRAAKIGNQTPPGAPESGSRRLRADAGATRVDAPGRTAPGQTGRPQAGRRTAGRSGQRGTRSRRGDLPGGGAGRGRGAGGATPGHRHDVLPVRGVHAEMAKRMSLSRSQIPDAHASVQVDGTPACCELRATMLGLTPFVLTLRLLVHRADAPPDLNATLGRRSGRPAGAHPSRACTWVSRWPRRAVCWCRWSATRRSRPPASWPTVVARLIGAAQRRHAHAGRVAGSTFTVSNFGALGLDEGVPVINQPGGRDPGHGIAAAACGRRRRCGRRASDDDADVCLRPPGRRRRTGGGIPGGAARAGRGARDGAARPVAATARRRSAASASKPTTACRVGTGSSELAISNAPRVSAPSSSRVTVSGSSTRTCRLRQPHRSARDGREGIALVEFGVAGQAEHGGAVDQQDPLHIGLQDTVEERVDAARELVEAVGGAVRGWVASAIRSVWACSKTASNRSDLVGKWW